MNWKALKDPLIGPYGAEDDNTHTGGYTSGVRSSVATTHLMKMRLEELLQFRLNWIALNVDTL